MHYEINVSLHGSHFFATAPRSASDEQDAKTLTTVLRAKFPAKSGYKVSVVQYTTTGNEPDWAKEVA